jgi:hypothetical protein
MVLTPRFRTIRRVWAGLFASSQGTHRRTIDSRTRPVDPIIGIQFGQQEFVKRLPDAGILPIAQSTPASHSAAAAQLLGEVFPANASFEHEKDSGERLAIVHPFSSWIAESSRLGGRQQRLDTVPEFIR